MNMSKARKLIKYIHDPDYRFLINTAHNLNHWMRDETFVKKYYHAYTGRRLDLKNPVTFNEKLQWLKLYDRKPIYTTMVDKYAAKKYVGSIIGEEHVIPTLGVWDHFDEINFVKLPKQFVLKCTHNSNGIIIVKDKSNLDIDKARSYFNKHLNDNFYYYGREWPYKNVKPRIIAEKYMEQEDIPGAKGELIDYKFYCFNGKPRFLYVARSNFINGSKNDLLSIYDLNWEKTPFYRNDHPQLDVQVKKPAKFKEMIDISRRLSKDIPFVRVDLYYINNTIYFSELTFFPGCGVGIFEPEKWEKQIGSWIHLPEKQ